MRNVVRAVVVALLALFGTVLLGLSVTTTTAVQLMAAYALKGTQLVGLSIVSDQAIQQEAILYGVGTPGSPPMVVQYPASGGLLSPGFLSAPTFNQSIRAGIRALQNDTANDSSPVIFGFSQGATVATEYKKGLNANPANTTIPTFVFIGNPNRPNGGVLSRFPGLYIPILDLTANGPTPTYTVGAPPGQITTTDIAGEYDPVADLPTNPLNPFSLANAGLGAFLVHLNAYQNADPSTKILQDQYGDTAYYLLPTYPVPLLFPVQSIPGVGPIAADMLDPVVRVLVESGYNRTISPGQPTTANFLYFPNPVSLATSLAAAIPTGLAIGFQDITGARQPGTPPAYLTGPNATYYIGGPPVTMNPTTNQQAAQQQIQPTTQLLPKQTMTVNDGPRQGDAPPRADNTPPSSPKTAPKLNLINKPFVTTSGDSSAPSKPAATKPSGPKLNNPISDGLNNFANTAKSTLNGLSKLGARGSNGSGQQTSGSNSTH